MLELNGRKVLVLGLGDTGMSMARWLSARGARVTVADTRAQPPHAAALVRELPAVAIECGAIADSSLRRTDLIAISPGIDRRIPAIADAIKRGTPVAGDVELFAQALPQLKSKPRRDRDYRHQRQKHGDADGRRNLRGGRSAHGGCRQYRHAGAGGARRR
jgi:UDP-N-acetylmuramoylalanine--D-glutamate ligase